MKACILEIGDIYVVNKVDLADADTLVANLRFQIEERDGWTPPIVRTSALQDQRIDELADAIEKHRAFLESSGLWGKRELARARQEILENARRVLADQVREGPQGPTFEALARDVVRRALDPQAAAARLLDRRAGPARAPKRRAARRQ